MEDPSLSGSNLKDLMWQGAAVVGSVWATLRFVFEPRLEKFIEAKSAERVHEVTERLGALDRRLSSAERSQMETHALAQSVATSVERIARLAESIAADVNLQGRHVAGLDATVKALAERVP